MVDSWKICVHPGFSVDNLLKRSIKRVAAGLYGITVVMLNMLMLGSNSLLNTFTLIYLHRMTMCMSTHEAKYKVQHLKLTKSLGPKYYRERFPSATVEALITRCLSFNGHYSIMRSPRKEKVVP